jgi:hypothetical protein
MKTAILLLFLTLAGCSKDSNSGSTSQLPPETQIGANTFGVTIYGRVYIPRDSNSTSYNWWGGGGNKKGISLTGGGIVPNEYTEIDVIDGSSTPGFELIIHIQDLLFATGSYNLKLSNFRVGPDSVLENHIFFRIYDSNINNYAYYGSLENQGFLIITRRNSGIISGTFNGKFVRLDNPNDFITITDGRFDINSFTIQNHRFP